MNTKYRSHRATSKFALFDEYLCETNTDFRGKGMGMGWHWGPKVLFSTAPLILYYPYRNITNCWRTRAQSPVRVRVGFELEKFQDDNI